MPLPYTCSHALGDYDPESAKDYIPDPTTKVHLPKTMLSALGNAHVNLQMGVKRLAEVICHLGWPEGEALDQFDFEGPPLTTALDFGRENARLTWVLCGLIESLEQSLGEMVWGSDEHGHPILECMDADCACPASLRHESKLMTSPVSRATFYKVDRPRAEPHPGAPRPVAPEDL